MLVEKDEGVEGLCLDTRGDPPAYRQEIEEGLELALTGPFGVLFLVKQDVLPNPVAVARFGLGAIVAASARETDFVQQPGAWRGGSDPMILPPSKALTPLDDQRLY